MTGHASEKSLYDYDEGNDSGQEPLASLHSQLLLEVSQVYQDMWSFPATSSTCEQVNTSDHNFTTVKSGVIYSSPKSVDQNIDCSWLGSNHFLTIVLAASNTKNFTFQVLRVSLYFSENWETFKNFTLDLTCGNIFFLIDLNKTCKQRRKTCKLARWNNFVDYEIDKIEWNLLVYFVIYGHLRCLDFVNSLYELRFEHKISRDSTR